MNKMLSNYNLLCKKIEKEKKCLSKVFSELECCLDFYVNRMFRSECCCKKKHCEIIDIISSYMKRK
ncbi:MAG: hypothetical protein ACM3UU_01020 [Ignavibacteriales bacterium]